MAVLRLTKCVTSFNKKPYAQHSSPPKLTVFLGNGCPLLPAYAPASGVEMQPTEKNHSFRTAMLWATCVELSQRALLKMFRELEMRWCSPITTYRTPIQPIHIYIYVHHSISPYISLYNRYIILDLDICA